MTIDSNTNDTTHTLNKMDRMMVLVKVKGLAVECLRLLPFKKTHQNKPSRISMVTHLLVKIPCSDTITFEKKSMQNIMLLQSRVGRPQVHF